MGYLYQRRRKPENLWKKDENQENAAFRGYHCLNRSYSFFWKHTNFKKSFVDQINESFFLACAGHARIFRQRLPNNCQTAFAQQGRPCTIFCHFVFHRGKKDKEVLQRWDD